MNPENENENADYISCLIYFDDWLIAPEFLLRLEELQGPYTAVDCFANFYTAKPPRFFFRFWNPETSRVDVTLQKLVRVF